MKDLALARSKFDKFATNVQLKTQRDKAIRNGWPPKLPKRINLPIFVPQSSPKRPPQTTQMGVPGKIWGRGQGTPVYPIFCLPI